MGKSKIVRDERKLQLSFERNEGNQEVTIATVFRARKLGPKEAVIDGLALLLGTNLGWLTADELREIADMIDAENERGE